jgi:hypothetical protein
MLVPDVTTADASMTLRLQRSDSRPHTGPLSPDDLLEPYRAVTGLALAAVERCYAKAGDVRLIRLHGDCHAGNILWSDDGPHFLDLDDARTGPAVRDLWMLLCTAIARADSRDGRTCHRAGLNVQADFLLTVCCRVITLLRQAALGFRIRVIRNRKEERRNHGLQGAHDLSAP